MGKRKPADGDSEWTVVGAAGKSKKGNPQNGHEDVSEGGSTSQPRGKKAGKKAASDHEKEGGGHPPAEGNLAGKAGKGEETPCKSEGMGGPPKANGVAQPPRRPPPKASGTGGDGGKKNDSRRGGSQSPEPSRQGDGCENPSAGPITPVLKSSGHVVRGLVRERNSCYQNAVLQSLFASPPFANFLHSTKSPSPVMKPLRHIFMQGMGSAAVNSAPIPTSAMLDAMATHFPPIRGALQADAHEYLLSLLDALAGEVTSGGSRPQSPAPDDGWETATKRGKSRGVEHTSGVPTATTPIHDIFQGTVSSRYVQKGCEPSVTVQPFFVMILEVYDDSPSLEECLVRWARVEEIESADGRPAKKQMMFSGLPPVLIFCLKKWDGFTKCDKPVSFPFHLQLPASAVVHRGVPSSYQLSAAVYHQGPSIDSGHYTAVIRGAKDDAWIHCDDTVLNHIPQFNGRPTQRRPSPYLLFYSRKK